jgi:UDP-N-acetylmuramoyl-tripeptide--D-alanyl-D-alanine ligase
LGVIELSLNDIALILDGRLVGAGSGETLISGSVQTDSRLVEPGSVFFALPG